MSSILLCRAEFDGYCEGELVKVCRSFIIFSDIMLFRSEFDGYFAVYAYYACCIQVNDLFCIRRLNQSIGS